MTAPDSTRGNDGFAVIAVATLLAGVGGYVVTTFAARGLGAEQYSVFAVFWGALYLIVGALAGLQQEFSRATHPALDRGLARRGASVAWRFIGGTALVFGVFIAIVLGALATRVFPIHGWQLVVPIIVGVVLYVAVATLTGVLYGLQAWWPLAIVIVSDVAVRAVAFAIVLSSGGDVLQLAWATVIPFPVIVLLLVGLLSRSPAGFTLDVGGSALVVNTVRTVGAGAGAALLVSGFTLLIGLAGGVGAHVGVVAYVLVLARAPLVVATMALQSYFVVVFRRRTDRLRAVFVISAVVGAAGALGAIAAWLCGPWVIKVLAGNDYTVLPIVPAAFVLVSVFTGWLTVSGSAVLSAGRHGAYLWGWAVAAVVASCALFVTPGDLDLVLRVSVALAVGPLTGIIVHFVVLARPTTKPSDASER